MAARSGQKLKLLHIIDILNKHSDEDNPISANEICNRLEELGVSAERKAIYKNLIFRPKRRGTFGVFTVSFASTGWERFMPAAL